MSLSAHSRGFYRNQSYKAGLKGQRQELNKFAGVPKTSFQECLTGFIKSLYAKTLANVAF